MGLVREVRLTKSLDRLEPFTKKKFCNKVCEHIKGKLLFSDIDLCGFLEIS